MYVTVRLRRGTTRRQRRRAIVSPEGTLDSRASASPDEILANRVAVSRVSPAGTLANRAPTSCLTPNRALANRAASHPAPAGAAANRTVTGGNARTSSG